MTEVLSIAASLARLISLGKQITQSLADFYTRHKRNQPTLAEILNRLESLIETFEHIERVSSGQLFLQNERKSVDLGENLASFCDELIQELQDEFQKVNATSEGKVGVGYRRPSGRKSYPFRQSTLQKLDEIISEIKLCLSMILETLQLTLIYGEPYDVSEAKALSELVKPSHARIFREGYYAAIEHIKAYGKNYPGTGMWLMKSSQFSNWLTEENSIIWLRGAAGSGKSVLCSTAIHATLRYRGYDHGIGIAFFYFTFDDSVEQNELFLIRTLISQLSVQLENGLADLMQQDDEIYSGKAELEHLRRLIHSFSHVYIFLDALNESSRNGPREQVFDVLEIMQKWDIRQLHFFITSRDEPDIRKFFDRFATTLIEMQNAGIDEDIANFISGRLHEDQRLRNLLLYHDKIQEALVKRARGV